MNMSLQPLPKKGDIPRPKTPPPHVFGHVLHQLWDNPPAVYLGTHGFNTNANSVSFVVKEDRSDL